MKIITKTKFLLIGTLVVATIILLFFIQKEITKTKNIESQNYFKSLSQSTSNKENFSLVCSYDLTINEYIDSLTYEQKISQLLVPAFTKTRLEKIDGNSPEVGGIVLIDTMGFSNSEEVNKQIDNHTNNFQIPAFIGIDSEGGAVERFSWQDFTTLKSLKGNPNELCANIEKDIELMEDTGINWSLAPIMDIPTSVLDWIYGRSIDLDKEIVSDIGGRYISCVESKDISATAKHFPGHGGTFVNSHYSIPKINYSLEEWDEKASKPFRKAIENKVDFVMMGHINYPNITDEISSSSPFWMNGILREKLGFTGIIVTDDIYMLSPNDSLDCSEEIAKSINNGADMTIFVDNPKCDLNEVYQYLTEFNLIDEDTIDERVENILKIKMQNLCTLKTDEPS